MSAPVVDAVIVSYNSRDTLRDCVVPLTDAPGVEVTVVDNASTDGSLEVVAGLGVRAVASGRNGGFSFGCNLGAAYGQAPYVLLLNPDARLFSDDLQRLILVLEREPSVALVAPRLLDGDGYLMPSLRRFPRIMSTWSRALFLHRLFPRAPWADEVNRRFEEYARPGCPEWVSGACMLVRRDVLEAVGGLDEAFFLYCEDVDLCAKIRALGHEIRFEPTATAQHHGGRSAPRTSLLPVLATSRTLYARKHSGRMSARVQCAGIAVDAATHAMVSVGRPAKARGHAAALRAACSA